MSHQREKSMCSTGSAVEVWKLVATDYGPPEQVVLALWQCYVGYMETQTVYGLRKQEAIRLGLGGGSFFCTAIQIFSKS